MYNKCTCTFYLTHANSYVHLINSVHYSCIYGAQLCVYTRLQAQRVLHFSASLHVVLQMYIKQKLKNRNKRKHHCVKLCACSRIEMLNNGNNCCCVLHVWNNAHVQCTS